MIRCTWIEKKKGIVLGQFVYTFILFRMVRRTKDKIKDKRQMEKRREVSFDAREKQSLSSKHLPAGFFKKINFHSG